MSVQSSGKKRLILDLRHVNYFLKKQKVKYEDWKVAQSYFHKGSFMFSFDLKSSYHHIEIHPDYQCFLGFAWEFEGDSSFRYFVFTVLPFGLSTAPHIFNKLLKPLEKHWRIHGINMALFLDDGMFLEKTEYDCKEVSQRVQRDLHSAGLVANKTKSIWEPQQSIPWLGIVWDSTHGTLRISDQRIDNINNAIARIFTNQGVVSSRELSSFVGKIVSAGVVYGNLSRIMTRYCSISIAAAHGQDWDSKFVLDEYCMRELKLWERNACQLNIKHISHDPSRKSHFIVCSDTSGVGCGAHLDLNGEQVCHKQWEECERLSSSTWRELSAIEFGIESFLQQETFQILFDVLEPRVRGCGFFVQKLQGENCSVVPPVDMIGRAVNYLFINLAVCTLVVPFWPSSYFWPIISKIYGQYIMGH